MQAVLSSWGGSTKLQFKILFPCILFALCALLASTFQFLKVLAFFGQIFESAGILWANFCTSSHLKGFVKRQRFDKMLSVYFFSSIFVVVRPVAVSINRYAFAVVGKFEEFMLVTHPRIARTYSAAVFLLYSELYHIYSFLVVSLYLT